MKKKYLFFCILSILFSGSMNAQPTITNADIINGTFQFTNVSFNQGAYSPGNAGANVTWDFSNIQGTAAGTKILYGDCSSAVPECSSFPTANKYSVSFDSNGNQNNEKNLFKVNSIQLEMLGVRNIATNYTLTYTDTPIELKFPTTYLQSFNDTSSYTVNGVTTNTSSVITADGYGTVKTPAGTYANVLRVKKESTVNISMSGAPVSTTQITTYAWYKNSREQIAVFGVSNLISPTPSAIPSFFQYTNNSSTLGTQDVVIPWSSIMYPNPSRDGKIWIDTKHDTIKMLYIYDRAGRQVFEQAGNQISMEKGIYLLNLHFLPDDHYILKIETEKGENTNKIQLSR
ncbi:secretion protein [Chryseobacterium phosphatilyticum]|uniref:Secretion protein n=1 Tax=Chryseobacterium phosphatilyticum TaxID=475075 RepID=A0A316XDQ9_9FLAO|nr:T9SS type A sorting domain-containing protein [Chryseobacterium phosphatilyticum]PWN68920.1 secretion protein [Chryseobacterium phosphatilyticum]